MALSLAQEQILPFSDNTEFLAMKLKEYVLRVEYVSLTQALDRELTEWNKGSAHPLYPSATRYLMKKVELRKRNYLKDRNWNNQRLVVSEGAELPFQELAAEHGLDPLEQEVLWILFFKAVSPLFRRTYEESGFYSFTEEPGALLCTGSLLQFLSPIPGVQIKLLSYFHPKSRLRRRDLVCLERPAARYPELTLETRFWLKESVRDRIIGT